MSDKTPEQIFLQWFDDDGEPAEEVTWCNDQILDSDVAYIRADIAENALREQTAKTIEMIAERNAIGHALDEQTARIADLEALCEIQELNLNKCHQSNIGLNEQAHTLRARIAELEAAIDDALAIIAGGNPDLPGDVLAEVQSRLQEVYDDNDSHPLPNY